MRPGHDHVAILSDALWRSHFGADPGIVGRTIMLDGAAHVVAGVLPRDFPKFEKEEIYTPLVFAADAANDRGTRFFGAIGRLRPGVSLGGGATEDDGLERAAGQARIRTTRATRLCCSRFRRHTSRMRRRWC